MKRTLSQFSKSILTLVGICTLVALSACTSAYTAPAPVLETTPVLTPEPPAAPILGPTIKITAPENYSTMALGNITVSVEVANFSLADKKGQAISDGEGHIHYFMDVDAPTAPDKPAVTAAGTYAVSPGTSYTWPNVTPGMHTFSVELVNNNHTPLSTPVIATVTVTVADIAASSPQGIRRGY